jgi:hypothetical protein
MRVAGTDWCALHASTGQVGPGVKSPPRPASRLRCVRPYGLAPVEHGGGDGCGVAAPLLRPGPSSLAHRHSTPRAQRALPRPAVLHGPPTSAGPSAFVLSFSGLPNLGAQQISRGKTLRFRRDPVANTSPSTNRNRASLPAASSPTKGRLTALHSDPPSRKPTSPYEHQQAARSIPGHALASSMLGSPCQGPRTGLPPPISNIMPGTPLRPTASATSSTRESPQSHRGEPMAISGKKRWPPPGRTDGRPWGEPDGR